MTWGIRNPLDVAAAAMDALERDIRDGQFDDILAHQSRIEAAFASIQGARLDKSLEAKFRDLKDRASRNARLLKASIAGIRDVLNRHKRSTGFASYDAQGRAGHVGRVANRFEQRS